MKITVLGRVRSLAVMLLAVPLLGGFSSRAEPSRQPEAAPKVVLVGQVWIEAMIPERRLPGTIRPRVETDLGFRISGKLIRRLVDTGQIVHAGQILAELDHTNLELQLQQAQAELAAARTARETSAAELHRTTSLRRSGWSTAADHDRQRAVADEAAARATRAERAVTLTRNAVDYATLRADADGVITAVLAEPGQVVSVGQATLRLALLDRLEVEVAVPETLLDVVRTGTARVFLWSLPHLSLSANLRELSVRADPATRTYPARFVIPPNAPGVTLGMTATVVLTEPSLHAVQIPLSAVLDEGHGPNVFVLDEKAGTIAIRSVTVARFGSDAAVVTEGLSNGERIVLLGVQKLQSGQRVRALSRLPF